MNKLSNILLLLITILILPSVSSSQEERVITLKHGCTSLDPIGQSISSCYRLLTDISEGLIRIGPNGEPEPGVAESWEWRDSKTLVFHLRKDRRWSDGKPVVAHDFALAWRRILKATKRRNPFTRALKKIKGSKHCTASSAESCPSGLRIEDDYTLVVEFDNVDKLFALRTLNGALMPIPSHFYELHEMGWEHHVDRPFNGAYRVSNLLEIQEHGLFNTILKLTPNNKHPDISQQNIKRVHYTFSKKTNKNLNKTDIKYFLSMNENSDVNIGIVNRHNTNIQSDALDNWKVIPQNDIGASMLLLNIGNLEPKLIQVIKVLVSDGALLFKELGPSVKKIKRLFNHESALTPFDNQYADLSTDERNDIASRLLSELSISKESPREILIVIPAGNQQHMKAIRKMNLRLNQFGIQLNFTIIDGARDAIGFAREKIADGFLVNWFVSLPHPSGYFLILDWAPFDIVTDQQKSVINKILLPSATIKASESLPYYHKAEEYLVNQGGIIPISHEKQYLIHKSDLCGITGNSSQTVPLLWMRLC